MTELEKKHKLMQKCRIVKPDQIGVCRFIEIQVQTFEQDASGKWNRTGMAIEKGLQYENKVKLIDGRIVYLNKPGTKIVTEYQRVPKWATHELEDIYVDYEMFDVPVPF